MRNTQALIKQNSYCGIFIAGLLVLILCRLYMKSLIVALLHTLLVWC